MEAVWQSELSPIVCRLIDYIAIQVSAMDIRERLAKNLRLLRQEKGWSQEAFADEADLHRTYISDLERGARNPTITVVDKLANALGVTPGRLLD
ncbi:helix-turn-helix domain-containing protein [Sphingopyxis indica]|nr:helix-turn-helix transcriptional regulator [Sphingopyxis indica]